MNFQLRVACPIYNRTRENFVWSKLHDISINFSLKFDVFIVISLKSYLLVSYSETLSKILSELNTFKLGKGRYLPRYSSDKCLKGIVVNRTWLFSSKMLLNLQGQSSLQLNLISSENLFLEILKILNNNFVTSLFVCLPRFSFSSIFSSFSTVSSFSFCIPFLSNPSPGLSCKGILSSAISTI